MCQPNQNCLTCLEAENKSKEKKGIFTCETCQANFQDGNKINY